MGILSEFRICSIKKMIIAEVCRAVLLIPSSAHVTKIYTHNLSVPKFFLSLAYLAYETFGAERLRVQILIT